MACAHCKKIRDAVLHGKMAEAAGLTVEALREKIGWKADATASQPVLVGETGPEIFSASPDAEPEHEEA